MRLLLRSRTHCALFKKYCYLNTLAKFLTIRKTKETCNNYCYYRKSQNKS